MTSLFFKDKSQRYAVMLDQLVYDKIILCCKEYNPFETGGILIGKYSADQSTANILQATLPTKKYKPSRCTFHRHTNGLKKILDESWEKGQYYLGEWHYHPNFSATPSSIDLKQMRTLAENEELKCPEPILIIIGGNKTDWKIELCILKDGQKIGLDMQRNTFEL
jgi:integrative and conjugative element protein (TIGR02256 family)